MKVDHLFLRHYRNIEKETVYFEDGVNFLYGENAQGKTNILEAIYFYARGKSFRSATDREQLSFGKEDFETALFFEDQKRNQEMSYFFGKGERVRKRNGVKIDKISDFIGHFRSVLFFPEDLSLVKGGPEERRNFLNVAISQCDPLYTKKYAVYKRCIEQRNFLLRQAQISGKTDENQLLAWNEPLSESAAFIHLKRKNYIKLLSTHASLFLSNLSCGKEKLSLHYESDVKGDEEKELKNLYFNQFLKETEREIKAGFSLFGPHRDDIEIKISGKNARLYASQGQQRSIVLSLKMGEGEVSRTLCGEYPVFLFDDVLSELDEKRRDFLLKEIVGPQMIVTGCDSSLFSPSYAHMIEVKEGRYVSSHR